MSLSEKEISQLLEKVELMWLNRNLGGSFLRPLLSGRSFLWRSFLSRVLALCPTQVLQASFNLMPQRKPIPAKEALDSVLIVCIHNSCIFAHIINQHKIFSYRVHELLLTAANISLVCSHTRSHHGPRHVCVSVSLSLSPSPSPSPSLVCVTGADWGGRHGDNVPDLGRHGESRRVGCPHAVRPLLWQA
jgi:hypothetical protein